ncbi:MAG: hypothetical protein ABIS50_09400 [Luteolibacter sp.]|uniref:hypothetical protein n=1 Tax=Luteolibacter sp. TaxID=1962973 RepID=UPI0032642CDA
MENPYKADDKVLIQRKGSELEAVVRTTWKHEVQVRVVVDRELLWRTVKTVKSLDRPDTSANPDSPDTFESAAPPIATDPPSEVGHPESEPEVLPDSHDVPEAPPPSEESVATASDSLSNDQPGKRTGKTRKRRRGTPRKSGLDDNFDQ